MGRLVVRRVVDPGEHVDVRRRACATPSSSARRPMPVYTAASSVSKTANSASTNGSADGPGGSRRYTRSAGAYAPSRTVVADCVARMPRVSQSSRACTPPSCRATTPCTRRGSSGSESSRPNVASRVQTGDSDVNDLRAVVPVAAVGLQDGTRARAEHHQVVAGLGAAEREHLAGGRVAQHELHRRVAARHEERREPRDDQVHVRRERGRRCGTGEPHLLARDLLERQPGTAEPLGDERREVARGDEVRGRRAGTCCRGRARRHARGCARARRRSAPVRSGRLIGSPGRGRHPVTVPPTPCHRAGDGTGVDGARARVTRSGRMTP